MSRYFILGQIAALDYIEANTKPMRHDIRNRYIKTMLAIAIERQRLTKMLEDGEMRYTIWNGGNR